MPHSLELEILAYMELEVGLFAELEDTAFAELEDTVTAELEEPVVAELEGTSTVPLESLSLVELNVFLVSDESMATPLGSVVAPLNLEGSAPEHDTITAVQQTSNVKNRENLFINFLLRLRQREKLQIEAINLLAPLDSPRNIQDLLPKMFKFHDNAGVFRLRHR